MKDWIHRHILLTREERFLIAGILLIALVGLGARFLHNGSPELPDRDLESPSVNIK